MLEKAIEEIWLEYLAETDFQAGYSSIAYITDCLTRSYYRIKLNSYEESYEKRYYRASGRLLHAFLLNRLAIKLNAQKDVYLKYETPDFVIAGKADLVADNYIVELKTVSKIPDKPNEVHIEQLNAYMAIANKAYGYVLYVSRVNGLAKCFEIIFNPQLWQSTQDKAKELKKACLEDYPPEPHKPKSWLAKACKYCEFKNICSYKVISEVSLNGYITLAEF